MVGPNVRQGPSGLFVLSLLPDPLQFRARLRKLVHDRARIGEDADEFRDAEQGPVRRVGWPDRAGSKCAPELSQSTEGHLWLVLYMKGCIRVYGTERVDEG